MGFHFAAAECDVLLQAAARRAERVRDRDVNVVVALRVAGIARDRDGLIRNEQLDAHVELRVALLVVVRNLDDDRAAEDVGRDAAEAFDPSARRHFGSDAMVHSTELDIDQHDFAECRGRARGVNPRDFDFAQTLRDVESSTPCVRA